MKWFKFCVLALSMLLASCSSTYEAYWRSLQLALKETPDLSLSNQQISESPADLIYFRMGERPQFILALAFIENGDYKWISEDRLMFVEKEGRIIKTLGFNYDLMQLSNIDTDPIQGGIETTESSNWKPYVDIEDLTYGHTIDFTISSKSPTRLKLLETEFDTILIEEVAHFDKKGLNSMGVESWVNQYWFETKSGKLLKTRQKLSPFTDTFEVTYISRAVRLIPVNSNN
jgi:hypothetical protein